MKMRCRIGPVMHILGVLLLVPGVSNGEVPKSLLAHPLIESCPEIAQKLRGALKTVALAAPEKQLRYVDALAKAGRLHVVDRRLEVELLAGQDLRIEAQAAVESLGGVCIPPDTPDQRSLGCFLPATALIPLARHEVVAALNVPAYAIPEPEPAPVPFPKSVQPLLPPEYAGLELAGSILTEGVLTSNAIHWIQKGITGKGVKVGVIDSGFQGYPLRQAEGELPAVISTKNFVVGESQSEVNGTTKHGTACAEIIYDLAPGCSLFFAKVQKPLEVGQAFTWLLAQGVKVISSSIGFHSMDPGDGSGFFPDLAAFAEAGGIVWVTSAGNERRYHYDGPFNPLDIVWSGWPITVHRFAEPLGWINVYGESTTNPEMIDSFNVLSITLRWSDWINKNMDLDLYLARWDPDAHGPGNGDWRVVDESIRQQSGGVDDTPVEEIDYVTSDDPSKYGIFVRAYNGVAPANIELFAPRASTGRLAYMVNARSLNNMAQSSYITSVGSMLFNADIPDDYSSEGPTNGPGGVRNGGFIKPDLCGYSGVSTKSFGYRTFTGTSAAAPHVAGATALIRERFPAWSPQTIWNYLTKEAIDIDPQGVDNRCGYGRLHLGLVPANAPAWFLMLLLDTVNN